MPRSSVAGVGLGLRWDFLEEVRDGPELEIDFFEVSPENYLERGGYYPAALERIGERYPLVTHGLTASLGAADDPDAKYLDALAQEVARLGTPWHSDHLCFSTAGPLVLHQLLPLKFCEETVARVADRLRRMEDRLGVPMAIENVSYYAHPGKAELSEAEFLQRVLDRSQCKLLLDVNNVYVNAKNHGFDAAEFILALPLERVVEIHIAGHARRESGLLLDTHGTPISEPVFELLAFTLERTGAVPVLLERDNDVPALNELLQELQRIRALVRRVTQSRSEADAARA